MRLRPLELSRAVGGRGGRGQVGFEAAPGSAPPSAMTPTTHPNSIIVRNWCCRAQGKGNELIQTAASCNL
eukprot:92933-Alexandrium_andersonii.AAC.1